MSEPNGNGAEQHSNSKPWLKPHEFQPGQSGNPSGRPKGSLSLRELLRERLRSNPAEADELIQSLLDVAADAKNRNQVKALELLIDSNDGKLAQPLELSTQPLTVADNPGQPLLPTQDPALVNRLRNGG